MDREDCRYLNGYKPCTYHKESRVPCAFCTQYEPVSMSILIIKIGAAGEVIRNTPLLHRLRQLYPSAEITWVTDFPELIPSSHVDRIIKYSWESSLFLAEERFDLILSLDKEKGPCALGNRIRSTVKKGFRYSDIGKILPIDEDSLRKWQTGIDDGEMLRNTRHYVEEVFEICGFKWSGERYILPAYQKSRLIHTEKPVVGVNTGSGRLWRTRIPNAEKVEEIVGMLLAHGYEVILLGGPDEDARNQELARNRPVHYFGVRPYTDFINIVDNCQAVITPVTFTLHIAIGLGKKVLLLNNIFNKAEFHLYGLGEIFEPPLDCLGCYKKNFDTGCPVSDCTILYDAAAIIRKLDSLLGVASR